MEETPYEIIKKHKVSEVNIKKGRSVFENDMRISFNVEETMPLVDRTSNNVKTTRIKERTSYKIAWIKLDLTVVST